MGQKKTEKRVLYLTLWAWSGSKGCVFDGGGVSLPAWVPQGEQCSCAPPSSGSGTLGSWRWSSSPHNSLLQKEGEGAGGHEVRIHIEALIMKSTSVSSIRSWNPWKFACVRCWSSSLVRSQALPCARTQTNQKVHLAFSVHLIGLSRAHG